MTDSPRSTILPPVGAHVPSPSIPRSVPPPLPTSATPSEREEDLPQADPIAYLGTAQHPVSVAPTSLDLDPAPSATTRVLERVAMLTLAALLLAPIFLGLSGRTNVSDAGVVDPAGVTAGVAPAGLAPAALVEDGAEAPDDGRAGVPDQGEFVQMPPLEITSRWAEVDALRHRARTIAEKPSAEPVTTTAVAAPFDFSGAMNALTAAGIGRSQCGDDAVGAARVSVTFAPSGRATHALLEDGPLRGTAAGSCIARQLREVKIAPFEGDRATVRTTVFLR